MGECLDGYTYSKLLVLFLDTSTFVDDVHVVGENSVARVLRDDTKRNNNGEAPSVTSGLEEIDVASRLGRAVG